MPPTVSTVDPLSGPDQGDTERTHTESTSNCTPDDVYSRLFMLASTIASPPTPTRDGDAHTSADSLTYEASLADAFIAQTGPTD